MICCLTANQFQLNNLSGEIDELEIVRMQF